MIRNQESNGFDFVLTPEGKKLMKPCPFCGHKAVELVHIEDGRPPRYVMECRSCGCSVRDPRHARNNGERSHRASALRVIDVW